MEYDGWRIPVSVRQTVLAVTAVVAILVVAGVAVRGYGAARLDEVLEQSRRTLGPTEPGAYAPPPVAPEDDVAVRLAEVVARLEAVPQREEPAPAEEDAAPADEHIAPLVRLTHRSPSTWSAGERARVRDFLLPRAAVLARARSIADLPGSDFGLDREGPAGDLGVDWDLFRVERLLRLHANFAAAEGQAAVAAPTLAALGRLAEALYGESSELTFAFAAATERDQLRALRELLAAGVSDPAVLADLEATLVDRDPFDALRRAAGFEVARAALQGRRYSPLQIERDTPLYWRLAVKVAGRWIVAEHAEGFLPLAAAGRVPLPELERTLAESRSLFSGAPFASSSAGAFPARQAYEIALGRLLARRALEAARQGARDGGLPATLGPPPRDPVTGGAVGYRTTDDGAVVYAADGTRQALEDGSGLNPIPLEWPLPAIPAPPSPRTAPGTASATTSR